MRLSDRRYESMKLDVANLFKKHNINTAPIDAIALAEKMGIKLIKYSSLNEMEKKKILKRFPQAMISPDHKKIFYNDSLRAEIIRTSILHEIGHKVRKHYERSKLAEAEAEWFSAYAVAPPPVASVLIDNVNIFKLGKTFNLTVSCAIYSMERYNKWKQFGQNDAIYDIILKDLFSNN